MIPLNNTRNFKMNEFTTRNDMIFQQPKDSSFRFFFFKGGHRYVKFNHTGGHVTANVYYHSCTVQTTLAARPQMPDTSAIELVHVTLLVAERYKQVCPLPETSKLTHTHTHAHTILGYVQRYEKQICHYSSTYNGVEK